MRLDAQLFARHLDLRPLGARRAGLVRCIFHEDATASLSVDLDKGVWHCFGCGHAGGLKAFAARVGEALPSPVTDTRPTEEEAPFLLASRIAGRQPWARPLVAELYEAADRGDHVCRCGDRRAQGKTPR